MKVVYFSSPSGNTKRFVDKLDIQSQSIEQDIHEDFVLVTPTYGGGQLKGCVPKPVIEFLNVKDNRKHLVGVISTGNTNFGKYFAYAGEIISSKCKVTWLAKVELFGTLYDVDKCNKLLKDMEKQ